MKVLRAKKRAIFAFVICVLILCVFFFNTEDEPVKVILPQSRVNSFLDKPYYLIMEYTKVFQRSKYCEKIILNENNLEFNKKSKSDESYDLLDNCQFKNCYFTCEKSYSRESDALLFHFSDLYNEIEKNKTDYESLIRSRNKDQIWILWQDEPDYSLSTFFDRFKFNWTISFYRNSEASLFAYGGTTLTDDQRTYDEFIQKMKNDFEKRKNSAVWFVSNCQSQNRLKFANELGAHFPVIVNGACSKFLNSTKIIKEQSLCERDSACEVEALGNNKFYLAFESTNCSDYITEKYWRSVYLGLIPIVFQPSKRSYERVAPPDSFIHAQDFNYDTQLLARYLVNVSTDFQLYLKHVNWRFTFKAHYKGEDLEKYRFCQLCKKLNKETASIYYESYSNWFHSQCHSD